MEQLAIGNTGSQLVSKFNNNFDETISYTDSGIENVGIEVYDFTKNGLVGDGNTDNTTTLNSLLSSINSNYATIQINVGRFLIGSITIPENIELTFVNGGRILWASDAVVNIHGHINSGHKWIFENQTEVVGHIPALHIHRQDWISPIWWGLKMSGIEGDATINYNAFRSCWNAAARQGQTSDGSSIKFPSGTFFTNAIETSVDGWGDNPKYANIIGAGRAKTTMMLASNQNKCLFNVHYTYDSQIRDICFNGNAAGNTSMTDPCLLITYYRCDLIDVAIRNCTANGIDITPGQTNAIAIHNPLIASIGGIGINMVDALNVNITGCIDIESVNTAIMITGSGVTLYESRYMSRCFISGTWYGESLTKGIIIKGIGGVKVDIAAYARYCSPLISILYDSDRDMPSMFNHINVKGSRDPKDTGTTMIIIDDHCCFNTLFVNPGERISDSDGRNSINGLPWCQRIPGGYKGSDVKIYHDNTSPVGGYGTFNYPIDGSIFNDAISYSAITSSYHAVAGPAHSYTPTGNYIGVIQTENFEDLNTKYVMCVIKGLPGQQGFLYIQELSPSLYLYDFPRKVWRDYLRTGGIPEEYWNDNNDYYFLFDCNGDWQTFIVPFIPRSTTVNTRTFVYGGFSSIEVAYLALTNRSDTSIIHKKSGNIIGYDFGEASMPSTSVPPANKVSIGTRIFATDLGMNIVTNGTNWKKPDGSSI